MSDAYTEQPPAPPSPPVAWEIPVLGGCVLLIGIAIAFEKVLIAPKQTLGRARWASWREIRKSQDYAYQQMHSPKLTDIALWVGQPKGLQRLGNTTVLPLDRSSLLLGDLSQHMSIWASTGSGKTYSLDKPMTKSAIDQNHSLIVFDAKGDEPTPPSCETAGYALLRGYKVFVLAPGSDDSDSMNTWDFINHSNDTDRATTKADSLLANFKMGGGGGANEFFVKAAGQLLSAILLMVKDCDRQYQDMALVQKIISLPNLVERVLNADLSEYQKAAWGQFISTAGSPETASSIVATAGILIARFFTPQILSVFRGLGNCPTEIHGKTMVIFRMNPELESMKPLIAAGIQMMITRNTYCQRKNPIGIFLDELPQIRILGLEKILNVARSKGAYFVLSAQGFSNMEQAYGKAETRDILNATLTQAVGRLNEGSVQKYFVEQLGRKQIQLKNRGRSHGKNSSRSENDSTQATELVTAQEIRGLRRGEFIFFSPTVGHQTKSIPFKKKVRISEREKMTITEGLNGYQEHRQKGAPPPLTDAELQERELLAYQLLPLPEDDLPEEYKEVI